MKVYSDHHVYSKNVFLDLLKIQYEQIFLYKVYKPLMQLSVSNAE